MNSRSSISNSKLYYIVSRHPTMPRKLLGVYLNGIKYYNFELINDELYCFNKILDKKLPLSLVDIEQSVGMVTIKL